MRRLVGVDAQRLDRCRIDLGAQIDRGRDRQLAGVAHRIRLDVGLLQAARLVLARLGQRERARLAQGLLPDAEHPLEGVVRPGQAGLGEARREDAVARAVGAGTALPHRQLAGAGLVGRQMRHDRERDRVAHLLGRQAEQLAGGKRAGHGADQRLVVAGVVERHRVGEAALDLVGDRQRQDEVAARAAERLGHGEDARQVVGRVRGVERAPGVVEVEVAHHGAVDERCHVGRGALAAAPDARAPRISGVRRDHAGDARRRRAERRERHADGIQQPRLGGVDRGLGQVAPAQARGEIDDALGC